jgi:hypothetical protein
VYFNGSILTEYSTRREWSRSDSGDPQLHELYVPIGADTAHLKGHDDFTAYMKIPLSWCDIKLGYDRVSWGYADSSGLMFSGIGSPFLHMKLDKTFGTLNYTFLIGKLTGDTYEQRRVIYAKHITYTPRRWLSLGFSDAVISNREIEPAYFLPFVPFYFTERFLGSPDNRIMGFDGKLLINQRWTAYGEFLIDDLSNLLGIFRNTSWGDKWGGLFGVKLFNPVPALHTSAIKLEIVQIEPWVYTTSSATQTDETRNYPVNFGQLLGNELGPHSRAITLDFSCQLSKRIGGGLSIQQVWKGKGAGSNVFDSFYSVFDTASDPNKYTTKAYRFQDFYRNRTIMSLRTITFLKDWLLLNCYGDFTLERKPVPVDLFRIGVDAQVNY